MPPKAVTERLVIASALVLTCVVFLPAAADPVNVIKLTIEILAALTLLVLVLCRTARDRVVVLPRSPAAYAGVALFLALVIATIAAPHTSTAVAGTDGRNSGLLAYAAALIIFFVVLATLSPSTVTLLPISLIAGGAFTAMYGLFQKAGIDAIAWNNPFNPIIASLGNPDFASAYLGLAVPACAWGALQRGWHIAWRAAAGVTGVACFVTASMSSAVQGPIAALAGLWLVLLAVALDAHGRRRTWAVSGLAIAVFVGVGVLAAGAAGSGPATSVFSGTSYRARAAYMHGAWNMFRHRPVAGVGLDTYGIYWPRMRPPSIVRELGGAEFSDSAHSVPMQMLAQGGLILGLAYLTFVIITGGYLVTGFRRLRGEQRLLLAGIGGSWLAYQVQSSISIDHVPLLLVHYVFAAGIVVAAGRSSLREVRLPGALAPPGPPTGRRKQPVVLRRRAATGGDIAVMAGLVVVAMTAAWFASAPLRASMAVHDGDVALSRGQGDPALAAYKRATDITPGNGLYWYKLGKLWVDAQRPDDALKAFLSGTEHDPFDLPSMRTAADLAAADGDDALARRLYRRAVVLDPLNSATLLQAAGYETKHGQAAWVVDLLEGAVEELPDAAPLWAGLGEAHAALGDVAEAKAAYEKALALDPAATAAKEGLAKLRGPEPT